MSGIEFAAGHCYICLLPFTFNPDNVPSWPPGPTAQPICRPCVELINEERRKFGHTEFTVRGDTYPT